MWSQMSHPGGPRRAVLVGVLALGAVLGTTTAPAGATPADPTDQDPGDRATRPAAAEPEPAPVDTDVLAPGWYERGGDPPLGASADGDDPSSRTGGGSPGCTFDGSNYWNGDSGNSGGRIARSAIVRRAASWIGTPGTEWCASRPFPNSFGGYPGTNYGRYRVDCSGFVSMAWGLQYSYSSGSLSSISTRLASIDHLRPGDILVRPGHAAVFVRWEDSRNTLVLQQESSQPHRANRTTRTRSTLDSSYVPYRYDKVVEPPPPSVWSYTVMAGGRTSSTNVTLPARGGSVKLTTALTYGRTVRFSSSPSIAGLPYKARVSDNRAVRTISVPANKASTAKRYRMSLTASGPFTTVASSRHPTITVRAPSS